MKVFFDTEFTGLRKDTTLISIGLISEDGETFYAEFSDYNKSQVDEWIQENVINNLKWKESFRIRQDKTGKHWETRNSSVHIRDTLKRWLEGWAHVEMWSDCLAYDWVLFCNLFGGAFNIPKCVYYIPFDISTMFKLRDIDPDVNREKFTGSISEDKHNSLWDAKIIKECYDILEIL